MSTPFFIVAEGATPSGRGVLHSNARAACAARCACACHAPRGEGSQRKDACIEANCVPKPRTGPVLPRCMRYKMRYAVCDVHVSSPCVGALHRFRVASKQYIALYVASTCRIDACCIGSRSTLHRCALHVAFFLVRAAPVRVARCICACRMLHKASARAARCIGARWRVASGCVACCSGACCTLHAANAQPHRSARSCSPLCRVCCACASRWDEGRAVAAAERRHDALVRRGTAACSPWPRAPRCSTPWRYPTPEQRCVRG